MNLPALKTYLQIGESFTKACKVLGYDPKTATELLQNTGGLDELKKVLKNTYDVYVSDANQAGINKDFAKMREKTNLLKGLKPDLGYWEAVCTKENATTTIVFRAIKQYGLADAPTVCGFDENSWAEYINRYPNLMVFK